MVHTDLGKMIQASCTWTTTSHPISTSCRAHIARYHVRQPFEVEWWTLTSSTYSESTFLWKEVCLSCTCSRDEACRGKCSRAFYLRTCPSKAKQLWLLVHPSSGQWKSTLRVGCLGNSRECTDAFLEQACSPCPWCLRQCPTHSLKSRGRWLRALISQSRSWVFACRRNFLRSRAPSRTDACRCSSIGLGTRFCLGQPLDQSS